MAKKVLCVFATRSGTTQQIAETVASTLTKGGCTVDLHHIREVTTIDQYEAVVIGTAIRAGMVMPEVTKFVKKFHNRLTTIPVAAFAVCLTMKEDTPENRTTVANYLEPIRKTVPLVSEAVLAGAIHFAKLGVFARLIIQKLVKAPEGDFRNQQKITEWAEELVKRLRSDEWVGGERG